MSKSLVNVILSNEPSERDRSLEDLLAGASLADLLAQAGELDAFRRNCGNLYQRVRGGGGGGEFPSLVTSIF